MRFDEMDAKMRIYEQSLDQVLLPDIYMVARLDGRGFTKLTKEVCNFEAPFDEKFRDMMVKTTNALMDCGFRVVYAYTESDEISLLFASCEDAFGRGTILQSNVAAIPSSSEKTALASAASVELYLRTFLPNASSSAANNNEISSLSV